MGRRKPNKPRRERNPLPPLSRAGECEGYQLDHRDGSMSCSRGVECIGIAGPHRGWGDCEMFGPCAYCAGPPVVWTHQGAP